MSTFPVTHDTRLIDHLLEAIPGLKRPTAKDRLKGGHVAVNGLVVRKATEPLSAGDVVEMRSEGSKAPRADEAEILHLDAQLVVVHKPSGLLSVSGRSGRDAKTKERTLINTVGPRLKGSPRLYPCQRLDRETSGVVLIPRSKVVQNWFFNHWRDVEKIYQAVVEGVVEADEGTVDVPLKENQRSFAVSVSSAEDALPARSHFRVLARGPARTLLEVRLETGRKHQIRVHLAHIGHPVVGDKRYGEGGSSAFEAAQATTASGPPGAGKEGRGQKGQKRASPGKGPRLALHAHRLVFTHPETGERMTFEVEVPTLFKRLLKAG